MKVVDSRSRQGAIRSEGRAPSQGVQRGIGCEDTLSCFDTSGSQYQGRCSSLISLRYPLRPPGLAIELVGVARKHGQPPGSCRCGARRSGIKEEAAGRRTAAQLGAAAACAPPGLIGVKQINAFRLGTGVLLLSTMSQ